MLSRLQIGSLSTRPVIRLMHIDGHLLALYMDGGGCEDQPVDTVIARVGSAAALLEIQSCCINNEQHDFMQAHVALSRYDFFIFLTD